MWERVQLYRGYQTKVIPGLVILPVIMAPGPWWPRARAIVGLGLVVCLCGTKANGGAF